MIRLLKLALLVAIIVPGVVIAYDCNQDLDYQNSVCCFNQSPSVANLCVRITCGWSGYNEACVSGTSVYDCSVLGFSVSRTTETGGILTGGITDICGPPQSVEHETITCYYIIDEGLSC